MSLTAVYFWKKAPFSRLLISLATGILLQWYGQLSLLPLLSCLLLGTIAGIFFPSMPLFTRYRWGIFNGLFLFISFASIGGLLAWDHNIRHTKNWLGRVYKESSCIVATLEEPLTEKSKSFKANARLTYLFDNNSIQSIQGKIILYFKKDSLPPTLVYGSQIVLTKSLQEIKNTGNPGGFDYQRYCLFQGITHQVYLTKSDFSILPYTDRKWLPSFLEQIRQKVLHILRSNIHGDKETGLAEALLIGYKDDLDKTLVQSYTNTGVVHIIAISGLHLGLIYWLLLLLLKPLQGKKYAKWIRPLIIISGLWIFSLLAGAQPSILRSAVMFTCIVLGENLSKKTSVYNTLALSAFILLCYNPYWLWDVGFQLSYSAILSILIFMQPVYNLFYIKNKLLDGFWKLNAVTIAAQILTLPVSIYHFHQFPSHFLLTNILAVPLSSIILLGEIFLCIISFIPPLALITGKMLSWLIQLMNSYIEKIEALPYSLFDGFQINIGQAILLYIFLAGTSYWLIEKSKPGLRVGLAALVSFLIVRTISFRQSDQQQKMIVYNVPQHQAIDFIKGHNLFFTGDSDLVQNDFIRNFHLKPSRVLQRVKPASFLDNLLTDKTYFSFGSKKILLLDHTISFNPSSERIKLDILIISKKPRLYISRLSKLFIIKQIVFDSSVPPGKLLYWKKDCDSLGIPYHDVAQKGAFVMNLN